VKNQLLGAELDEFIKDDAKAFQRFRPQAEKEMAQAGAQARDALFAYQDAFAEQGRTRMGRAAMRAAAPVTDRARAFGRQVGLIAGDAKAMAAPRARAAYAVAKERGAQAMDAGKKVYGVASTTIGSVKEFAKKNRMAIPGVIAALSGGLGVVDVMSDGKLNFRFDKVPDAYKHLADKNHRPQAAMYFLNNGRDVAYVMTGKTKAQKGQEATDVVLSGTIIRENGSTQDITPLTPLRTFLQNNQGGGGGGKDGGSRVQLRGDQATLVGSAVAALKGMSGSTKAQGDEEWSWNARDPNHQDSRNNGAIQKGAEAYLDSLQAAAKGGVPKESFYAHLADIFESSNSDLLTPAQARGALVGDQKGNERRRGLFNEGVRKAYDEGKGNELAAALKQQIQNAPAWDDGQEKGLYRAVHLLRRKKGDQLLNDAQVKDLHATIEKRRSGGGSGGGDSQAGEASSGSRERAAPGGTSKFDYSFGNAAGQKMQEQFSDFMARTMGIEDNANARELVAKPARDALEQAMDEIRAAEERGEASIKDQQDLYRKAMVRAQKALLAQFRTEKSVVSGDLAKASLALLAKAEIPPGAGARRQFEESKVRRAPRGDDRGGEFAPKGSPSGQRADSERSANGKRADNERPADKQRARPEPEP
jgi:hypothetical protein